MCWRPLCVDGGVGSGSSPLSHQEESIMRRISLIMIIGAALALIGLICITGSPRFPWIQTASAMQEDQPTIAKDSVQVTAFTFSVYRKNYDTWSWVPKIEYRVNGPIASGSRLFVEFTIPGSGPWVKFDCQTEATQKGFSWKTECGAREIPEDKGTTYAGPVNFA